MAITRYSPRGSVGVSPWRELEQMSNRLTRLFDESWPSGTRTANGGTWFPAVNVEETADELVLTAELPGMSHEDIELEVENNVLTISGEKRNEREETEERRYHLWERTYGSFQRSFTLPRTVDADSIEARFKDGVLHVHLPKMDEAKGRKISIRTEQ
jgi:HSP20 family protein